MNTDTTYSPSLASIGETRPQVIGPCPLPVVDLSGSVLDIEKYLGGATGPVIVYDGKRAVLVSEFPIELVHGNMHAGVFDEGQSEEPGFRHPNKFIHMGDYWVIRFHGVDIGPLKHEKGMVYIHRLLSNPSTTFNYHELSGVDTGIPEKSSIDMSNYTDGSENQIGSITRTPGSSVDATDQRTRDEIKKELRKLIESRKNLEEEISRLSNDPNLDIEAIEKIENLLEKKENEIKDLQKYERKYSFGGEKIMDVEEKNLRNRTQTAINRCIQSIEMSNPQLGSHLAKHISRFNGTVVYYPPVDVIWETI